MNPNRREAEWDADGLISMLTLSYADDSLNLKLLKKEPIHFHECLGLECKEYSRSTVDLQGEKNTTEMQQHTLMETMEMNSLWVWPAPGRVHEALRWCRITYLPWAKKDSQYGQKRRFWPFPEGWPALRYMLTCGITTGVCTVTVHKLCSLLNNVL